MRYPSINKNFICFLLLTFYISISIPVSAQDLTIRLTPLTDEQIERSGASKLIGIKEPKAAASLAKKDIEHGTPFLFLNESAFSWEQHEFETDYKIYYWRDACRGDIEIIGSYNLIILNHFREKFGNSFIERLEKEVVWLEQVNK